MCHLHVVWQEAVPLLHGLPFIPVFLGNVVRLLFPCPGPFPGQTHPGGRGRNHPRGKRARKRQPVHRIAEKRKRGAAALTHSAAAPRFFTVRVLKAMIRMGN